MLSLDHDEYDKPVRRVPFGDFQFRFAVPEVSGELCQPLGAGIVPVGRRAVPLGRSSEVYVVRLTLKGWRREMKTPPTKSD